MKKNKINLSREQLEEAIQLFNRSMDDYLYLFDIQNDYYSISKQSDLLNKDKINLNDMSKQLETVFKDLAENINLEDIENMDGAITFNTQDEDSDDEDAPKIAGAAIPLGSIFSNMFGSNRK